MSIFGKQGYIRSLTRRRRRKFAEIVRLTKSVWLARINRLGLGATMVSVTGSSCKTTTSSLLAHILSAEREVALGAIGNSLLDISQTLRRMSGEEDFAVVETAAFVPGDIARKARLVRPHVAIVTLVSLEHYASFRTLDAIAEEKADLVRHLKPGGLAVLNADDPRVSAMRDMTKARCVTFGRNEGADYRVVGVAYDVPGSLTLDVEFPGGKRRLTSLLNGSHFWLPVAAAFAAAVELGIRPETAANRIAGFEPVFNRMSVMRGEGKPTFLLDAAKAPLASLDLAIEAIRSARSPYKRIIIGFISDFSHSSRRAYDFAYRLASDAADEVIFVGPNAHRARVPEEHVAAGRVFRFDDAKAVLDHIRATARPEEVILVKSSSSMHLERIGLALHDMVDCWEQHCGYSIDCKSCGMYRYPFHEHAALRRRNMPARKTARMATHVHV
ncbi:UDP-N-acetylmuramoyl-tripeptide--D-alanyl-D-alanine ligase [Pseudohoeflea suaedae]|uniref:UDP-N-acetylmuramoyl-tripeptide--D-alanyl-D-alanine ligase n=1 Tax=Pseudohoeflea suaedae TaxID=877384 RepID=A0A4R5PHW0_9HYPH|nr:Mur ligase family protein [Pseudohoeflea suaedae]TDH34805.1 UDP-N-acetylmuramoyl-tripeptide--D-alanyl-D-alanine ligase [Pseudohoeflea suaedae]